jgi:hypothetical protein
MYTNTPAMLRTFLSLFLSSHFSLPMQCNAITSLSLFQCHFSFRCHATPIANATFLPSPYEYTDKNKQHAQLGCSNSQNQRYPVRCGMWVGKRQYMRGSRTRKVKRKKNYHASYCTLCYSSYLISLRLRRPSAARPSTTLLFRSRLRSRSRSRSPSGPLSRLAWSETSPSGIEGSTGAVRLRFEGEAKEV